MRTLALSASTLFASASLAAMAVTDVVRGAADDALVVQSGGLDRLLVDERDAALRQALRMLGDRLAHLPFETDQPDMPGHLFKLACDLLMGPMSVRVGLDPDADPEMGPPFTARLRFHAPNPDIARERAAMLAETMAGGMGAELKPHPDQPDTRLVDLGGPAIAFGMQRTATGAATVISFNDAAGPEQPLGDLGLPPGVEPAWAMKLDMGAAMPFIEMMLEQAGPEGDMLRGQLAMMGLNPDAPMRLTLAMGHGPDLSHSVMRYSNFAAAPANRAMLSRRPLEARDLGMIPPDATYAQIGHMRIAGLVEYFDEMIRTAQEQAGAEAVDPLDMLREQTGIDLRNGFINQLGETIGLYMSDTTGGGGLISGVAFVEVMDEAAVRATLDQIAAFVNEMAAEHARGYVRLRRRMVNGHEMMTLSFPGLPIPMEVSMSVSSGFLWIGASPQAMLAGLDYARSNGKGLLAHPRFRVDQAMLAKATTVTFLDTPRMLTGGYTFASMAASALSNAVQVPGDVERDPGIILPPLPVLAKNAQPMISLGWMEGDDMVSHATSDRSMLVNLCGVAGTIGPMYGGLLLPALGAGLLMPAMEKARESAKAAQTMANLRQIGMAIHTHAAEHNDRVPASLDAIVDRGYLEAKPSSPFGPVFDEVGDYWLNSKPRRLSQVANPARTIAAYDRAMYMATFRAAVLFFDGHVEVLESYQFSELVEEEQHEGVDFQLPW